MGVDLEKDGLLEACKKQGYVPEKCELPGGMVFLLVKAGENPCQGCNVDRSKCGSKYIKGENENGFRNFEGN